MGLVRAFRYSYDLEVARKTCKGLPFLLNIHIKSIIAMTERIMRLALAISHNIISTHTLVPKATGNVE